MPVAETNDASSSTVGLATPVVSGGSLRVAHLVGAATFVVVGCLTVRYGEKMWAVTREMVLTGNLKSVSSHSVKLGAFFMLVVLQTTAILLFKACQVNKLYSFSPASSIAISESVKFCMAGLLHLRHVKASEHPGDFFRGVTPLIVANYAGLALLYCVNNYITFYVHLVADPGSYTLGKSVTPYLVAIMLRFMGTRLHELQWICIMVQCCSIAITQYNPCDAVTILPTHAYFLIAFSASITATCGVWNQKIIKGFAVPVNLQNMVMYTFGCFFGLIFFLSGLDGGDKSFFEGYSLLPMTLIISQAFQGLAVTFVLKYADAIIKNFAGSAVMAILVIISANFFDLHTSAVTWLGVTNVLVITYTYMQIATKLPKKEDEPQAPLSPVVAPAPQSSKGEVAAV